MPAICTGNSESTHRNRAVRLPSGMSAIKRSNLALFSASAELPRWPGAAAKRAEKTPGAPSRASTSNPESSASTASSDCVCEEDSTSHRRHASALIRAFSAKVAPVSSGSKAIPRLLAPTIRIPGPRMDRISSILWRLWVAMSRRCTDRQPIASRRRKQRSFAFQVEHLARNPISTAYKCAT